MVNQHNIEWRKSPDPHNKWDNIVAEYGVLRTEYPAFYFDWDAMTFPIPTGGPVSFIDGNFQAYSCDIARKFPDENLLREWLNANKNKVVIYKIVEWDDFSCNEKSIVVRHAQKSEHCSICTSK